MKKTKGFTLVELVVVIAIVGVLASILVPTMLTYIRKAKLKSANTNAKTAYNAVAEFVTTTNAETGEPITTFVPKYGGGTVIDCNIPPNTTLKSAQKAVHDVADHDIDDRMIRQDCPRHRNADEADICIYTHKIVESSIILVYA